jgi:hypothetical protein
MPRRYTAWRCVGCAPPVRSYENSRERQRIAARARAEAATHDGVRVRSVAPRRRRRERADDVPPRSDPARACLRFPAERDHGYVCERIKLCVLVITRNRVILDASPTA